VDWTATLPRPQRPLRLMPSQWPAVRSFRGATLPINATGKPIPAHMVGPVGLCRDGQQHEQCEIGSQVDAIHRDGFCDFSMTSLRGGSKQYRRRGGYWRHIPRGPDGQHRFYGIGESGDFIWPIRATNHPAADLRSLTRKPRKAHRKADPSISRRVGGTNAKNRPVRMA
jgi:hypothetical protein